MDAPGRKRGQDFVTFIEATNPGQYNRLRRLRIHFHALFFDETS
jgi:hypothetical protein